MSVFVSEQIPKPPRYLCLEVQKEEMCFCVSTVDEASRSPIVPVCWELSSSELAGVGTGRAVRLLGLVTRARLDRPEAADG